MNWGCEFKVTSVYGTEGFKTHKGLFKLENKGSVYL